MRSVGLHLRITGSLLDLARKAAQMQLPFFQCFFLETMQARMIDPTPDEINQFLLEYRPLFTHLYLHGSYWINLAGTKNNGHQALYRELNLAKKLEFSHIVLHPGSAADSKNKQQGIDNVARSLNQLFAKNMHIKVVLENTAHGGFSIGGDLHDFRKILEKMDKPENLLFCIDTAHAYSYGYDVSTNEGQQNFMQEIDATIGLNAVALIHLNDTQEKLGSKIDRHALIGEGLIGFDALREFAAQSAIAHVPLLLESPIVAQEKEIELVHKIRLWK